MDRIDKLCAYLTPCKTFADVGCDHGYCTRYMLKNSLCERAIISDISDKCLSKAQELLKDYIEDGKCIPVCCFGLEKIENSVDLVLIAGMGGEEITAILDAAYIPKNFVLQPMRNVREVREYLLKNGAEITCDDVFESGGKYYFVICGKKRGKKLNYTPTELMYGKGDVRGALGSFLKDELAKKQEYLTRNLSEASRVQILEQINLIEGILSGENK